VLAVHVEDDDRAMRNKIRETLGTQSVRIVTSGKFKKQ
jgi:hypothetical protein